MQPPSTISTCQRLTHCELPQFARDLLASPPQAGGGFNLWLYNAAWALKPYREDEEIFNLLLARADVCGRPMKNGEIERAIRNAKNDWQPGTPSPAFIAPRNTSAIWPSRNMAKIAVLAREGLTQYDLWEKSPVRMDEGALDAEGILDVLFPGNPLLCCGAALERAQTRPRDEWRKRLAAQSFVVPSPMSALVGTNQEGKADCPRCLDNTGPRRFLVAECDFKHEGQIGGMLDARSLSTFDLCAAVIGELATRRQLALVVNSGGKSLHGWFHCEGEAEESLRPFMRYAVSLGCDRATWNRSQFVRMPEGVRRENGIKKRQAVLYFNPAFQIS